MNKRIVELADISQQLTEPFLAELLHHALQESRKYHWASGVKRGGYISGTTVLTKGQSPEDLVQEALELTIAGNRPWNREIHPELSVHLKLCIGSLANNLANSWDNKKIFPVSKDDDGQSNPLESTPAAQPAPAPQPAQPDEVFLLEQCPEPMAAGVFTKIVDSMGGDAQLETLVDHLMNGEKPEVIEVKMGLSRKDVYRLMQKMRRHARQGFSGTTK